MEHFHDDSEDDDKPKRSRPVRGLVPAPWSHGAEAAGGHVEQKPLQHHVPLESILHMQRQEQQAAADKANRHEDSADDDDDEAVTKTPHTASEMAAEAESAETHADESREVEVALHPETAEDDADTDEDADTVAGTHATAAAQPAGSVPGAPPLSQEAAFSHVGAPYRSAIAVLERPTEATPAAEAAFSPLTAETAVPDPLVEAAYEASVPLDQEFQAFVRQEATAGVPLQDMETGPVGTAQEDDPTGAVYSGDGPAGPPPVPPAEHMPLGDDGEPAPRPQASYAYAPADAFTPPRFDTAPMVSHEQATTLDYDNEVYGRRRFLKGFLTGVAVTGFLARRRGNRFRQEMAQTTRRTERQQAAVEDRADVLQTSNEQLDARLQAAESQLRQYRAEQPPANPMTAVGLAEAGRPSAVKPEAARPAPALAAEQQPAEQPGYAPDGTPLAPGQRVERAGWYSVVKDEHNQVVENILEAGQAMKEEQQQEQMRDAVNDNDPRAADPAAQKAFYRTLGHATLPSGLTHPSLSAGDTTRQRADHRLQTDASAKKQLVTNLTNPWFWLMLALLVLAFFTANLVG